MSQMLLNNVPKRILAKATLVNVYMPPKHRPKVLVLCTDCHLYEVERKEIAFSYDLSDSVLKGFDDVFSVDNGMITVPILLQMLYCPGTCSRTATVNWIVRFRNDQTQNWKMFVLANITHTVGVKSDFSS